MLNGKEWNWKTQRWDNPDQITGPSQPINQEGGVMTKQVQKPMFASNGKSIKFGIDTFKKGQNYTVRLGDHYAENNGIMLGSIHALTTVGGEHLAEGAITHIISCRMRDIPNDVFKNHNDPDCHNPICLFDEMIQRYPDDKIDRNTMVTCLGFTVLG